MVDRTVDLQQLNSKKDLEGIRQLFVELVNNSSAHGIPNIARAATTQRRVLWSLLFMTAVGFFIGQFSVLISRFIDYPVSVNLDVKFDPYLTFPAVTVCNQNPIRKSMLDSDILPPDLFGSDNPTPPPPHFGGGNHQNHTNNSTDVNTFPPNTTNNTVRNTTSAGTEQDTGTQSLLKRRRRTDNEVSAQTSSGHNQKQKPSQNDDNGPSTYHAEVAKFAETFSSLEEDVRIELGHQADVFIVNCSWQGYQCWPDNFTVFSDSMYGNCFTFNGIGSDYLYKTSFPGPLYGLSLQLNIEQHEYLEGYETSSKAGARVTIHDQNKMPFPKDNAYTVPPGFATSIGVRRVEVQRREYPYSDCVEDNDSSYDNSYSELYGVGYSVQTCKKSCYQHNVISQCDCADSYYPYDIDLYSPCDSTNSTQTYCMAMVEYNYTQQLDGIECNCPQPCSDISYTSELSSAAWPSKSSRTTFLEGLEENNPQLASLVWEDMVNNTGAVAENLLQLDIYFQELNYEILVFEPSYEWTDLGSDFGGLIGLWIGVSVLTCFEFVEFLFDFFRVICCKSRKSQNSRINVNPYESKKETRRSIENDDGITLHRRRGFPSSSAVNPYDLNVSDDVLYIYENHDRKKLNGDRKHGRENTTYNQAIGYHQTFLENEPYSLK